MSNNEEYNIYDEGFSLNDKMIPDPIVYKSPVRLDIEASKQNVATYAIGNLIILQRFHGRNPVQKPVLEYDENGYVNAIKIGDSRYSVDC